MARPSSEYGQGESDAHCSDSKCEDATYDYIDHPFFLKQTIGRNDATSAGLIQSRTRLMALVQVVMSDRSRERAAEPITRTEAILINLKANGLKFQDGLESQSL